MLAPVTNKQDVILLWQVRGSGFHYSTLTTESAVHWQIQTNIKHNLNEAIMTILTEAMPSTSMLISMHNNSTGQLKYVLLMQHTGPCMKGDNWKRKVNQQQNLLFPSWGRLL
jgi:hypothetical protein